jgi:two-component system, NarL family, response regulator LiaR
VPRVFHCDDSFAYRRLVRAVMETEDDIEMVGEAVDRDTLLAGLAETQPDILLLDMVRGVTDADLADALQEAAPGLIIIVLSGHPPEHVHPSIRAVCAAHVRKSTTFGELTEIIRAAAMRTNVEYRDAGAPG